MNAFDKKKGVQRRLALIVSLDEEHFQRDTHRFPRNVKEENGSSGDPGILDCESRVLIFWLPRELIL